MTKQNGSRPFPINDSEYERYWVSKNEGNLLCEGLFDLLKTVNTSQTFETFDQCPKVKEDFLKYLLTESPTYNNMFNPNAIDEGMDVDYHSSELPKSSVLQEFLPIKEFNHTSLSDRQKRFMANLVQVYDIDDEKLFSKEFKDKTNLIKIAKIAIGSFNWPNRIEIKEQNPTLAKNLALCERAVADKYPINDDEYKEKFKKTGAETQRTSLYKQIFKDFETKGEKYAVQALNNCPELKKDFLNECLLLKELNNSNSIVLNEYLMSKSKSEYDSYKKIFFISNLIQVYNLNDKNSFSEDFEGRTHLINVATKAINLLEIPEGMIAKNAILSENIKNLVEIPEASNISATSRSNGTEGNNNKKGVKFPENLELDPGPSYSLQINNKKEFPKPPKGILRKKEPLHAPTGVLPTDKGQGQNYR